MDKLFASIYKNIENPSSFSSVQNLFQEARKHDPSIKLEDVQHWLSKQDAYTLHKPAIRKFKRNRILVNSIDAQWEMDLVDMISLSEFNDNYKHILTCIDVLSKYAWAVPLKDKTSKSICTAFESILADGRLPTFVRTDKGREFVNREFKKLLDQHDIKFFTSQNEDIKCSIIERWHRTLKQRMWRYFTENGTFKWCDVLPQLVKNYNNTVHHSIGIKPVDVMLQNESAVWHQLYKEKGKLKKPKFSIGDYVRISKHRQIFDKGYVPQWTEEIFQIASVFLHKTEPLYKITDLNKEDIEGTFYEKELQKITFDPNRVYKIERVIKKRRLKNGRVQLYVKWWGYPEKFNEWIFEDQLEEK